jgi:hypothetical protein
MASELSEALGTPVAFVDIPESAMRDAFLAFGLAEWQADGVIEDYAHYRRGEASTVSNAVRDVTGNQPRSFEPSRKTIGTHFQTEFGTEPSARASSSDVEDLADRPRVR